MFSNDIYRSANNRIEFNGKNQQVWPFIMIQRENYIDHFYHVKGIYSYKILQLTLERNCTAVKSK